VISKINGQEVVNKMVTVLFGTWLFLIKHSC